jgi:hypothetical protein
MAYEDLLAPGTKPWATLYLNAVQLQEGATPGYFLTCADSSGSAIWAPLTTPEPPGYYSVSAHWGDSAASFALPSTTTTQLPIDTIDINQSGTWSIVSGGLAPARIGTYQVSVTVTGLQDTSEAGDGYLVLVVKNGLNTIATSPLAIAGSTNAMAMVSATTMIDVSPGAVIKAYIENLADDYQILGNALGAGGPPFNAIQYNIICLS